LTTKLSSAYFSDQASGGLAQLGERQAGSLKVTGSIPVSSTKNKLCNQAQTPALERIPSAGGLASNCNEAQKNDLKSNRSRQVTAKENSAAPPEIPEEPCANQCAASSQPIRILVLSSRWTCFDISCDTHFDFNKSGTKAKGEGASE